MLQFRFVARTHVGTVRHHNEDSAFAGVTLLLVADGVGGAAAGEVASASAAYVVSAAALMEGETVDPALILDRSIDFANRHIYEAAQRREDWLGMSTTLTAVLTDGERVCLAHVGDSRAYRYRDGELRQLTRDDSLLQDLLDAGAVEVEDARSFPYRNVITRSIGQEPVAESAVTTIDLRLGDRLLLCSDGISDFVDDQAILDAMSLPLEDCADRLVETTLANLGSDNLTCVVADVTDGPRIKPYGNTIGAAWNPGNIIDGAAVRSTQLPERSDVLSFH